MASKTTDRRLAVFLRAAFGTGLMIFAAAALAQNAARGKQLFESKLNASYLSCSDGSCHGPNPLANMNNVRKGTNPQATLNALTSVPLMSPLRGFVSSTAAADLAAYIANPSAATVGSLTASGTSLTFGSTQVGATNPNSTPAAITLTNATAGTITITTVAKSGTHAAEFTPVGTCVGTAPIALGAGATCTLSATFTPAAQGTRTATLAVQSSGTTNPSITLSGAASATPVATMALSRATVGFPTQTIATTSVAQDVTVRNTGTATLTITALAAAPTPEFVASSNCVGSLIPGGSCSAIVVFTPSAAGTRTGMLTITASTGTSTVPLDGNAVLTPTAIATASRSAIAFPTARVGSTSPTVSLGFSNSGNAPLDVTNIQLQGADAKEFKLAAGTTCKTGALAPLAACQVEVAFEPQTTGGKTANLTVTHSAAGGSTTIPVTATAQAATAASGSSALFPSNVGGAGSLSLPTLLVLALVLLAVPTVRRRRAAVRG